MNVRDGRNGLIGSWHIEPLAYDSLVPSDIGRTVIYRDHGRAEAGTLSSFRDGRVWARFSRGDTAAACDPRDLCFGVALAMTATRHTIAACRSGSFNGMDYDNDYTITFTYRLGEEPVFVSIDPPASDIGAFTDLAQADLIDWAKNWLDENADRATDKAEADRATNGEGVIAP